MTPALLLSSARSAVNRSDVGLEGVWPRAAALLGRQSLEDALDEYWDKKMPGMSGATMATQLACLPQYMGEPEMADGVKVAWSALTRACHHHPYELSPTAAELGTWLDRVEALTALLHPE